MLATFTTLMMKCNSRPEGAAKSIIFYTYLFFITIRPELYNV